MRKPRPVTPRTDSAPEERHSTRSIPQPDRRRLALEAENAKLNAQVGVRISWIH